MSNLILKHIINLIGTCMIMFWITGCIFSEKVPQGNLSDAWNQTNKALLIVNKIRHENHLRPVMAHKKVIFAAQMQAIRMAKADKMSHFIGFGDNFRMRMKSQGILPPAAENIAYHQKDVQQAVMSWIHSPKHLKNILGQYSFIGVAVARDPASNFQPYWAMVLSK
ncbi:hypothetical protein RL73_00915 [Liberibacter crescens]|nr:hypothetical protein RL73_00915 [Liberibacter crescens]